MYFAAFYAFLNFCLVASKQDYARNIKKLEHVVSAFFRASLFPGQKL